MSEPVWRPCPTCHGRPWTLWDWTDEGWPIWCPGCAGRGSVPGHSLTPMIERTAADVPFVITDDDEEG